MGDENKADERFNYIKDRIAAAFPKLAGPKFEKSIQEEVVKYVTTINFYIIANEYLLAALRYAGTIVNKAADHPCKLFFQCSHLMLLLFCPLIMS